VKIILELSVISIVLSFALGLLIAVMRMSNVKRSCGENTYVGQQPDSGEKMG